MAWTETSKPQCEGSAGNLIHSHQNLTILRDIDGSKGAELYLAGDGTWRPIVATGAIGTLDAGTANSVYNITEDPLDGGRASSFIQ